MIQALETFSAANLISHYFIIPLSFPVNFNVTLLGLLNIDLVLKNLIARHYLFVYSLILPLIHSSLCLYGLLVYQREITGRKTYTQLNTQIINFPVATVC